MAARNRAEFVLRFRTEGERDVKRALHGMLADAQKTNKSMSTLDRGASREAQRNAQAQHNTQKRLRAKERRERASFSKEVMRAFREEASAAKKAAAEQAKAERELTAKKRRELRERDADAKRSMRDRERDARRAVQEANRALLQQQRADRSAARERSRRIGTARAGAALAVGAGVQLASQAQNTLGVRSHEQITSDAIGVRQNLIAQAAPLGLSVDDLMQRSIRVAQRTNQSPIDVIQSVIRKQEQFSSLGTAAQGGSQGLDSFFSQLETEATAARATRDEISNVSGAMGVFERQLGLSGTELEQAVGILYQGAQDGSLAMRDFSETMPDALAPFITARGNSVGGLGALREFAAVSQGVRAGDIDPVRARTLTQSLLTNLSDEEVQQRMRLAGVSATDANGNIRNVGDLVSEISRNDNFRTSTQMRSIFGNQEASAAMSILVNQEKQGTTLRSREGVDAGRGLEAMRTTAASLNADASGRAIRLVNERESSALGVSEELINSQLTLAESFTGLQNEFPRLTMAMDALAPIAEFVGGLAVAKAVLGVGGGAAIPAAVPGVAAGSGVMGSIGTTITGALSTVVGGTVGTGLMMLLSSLAGGAVLGGKIMDVQALNEREAGRTHLDRIRTLQENAPTPQTLASAGFPATWGAQPARPAGPAMGNQGGDESHDMQRQTQTLERGFASVVTAIRNQPAPTALNPGDSRPNGRP